MSPFITMLVVMLILFASTFIRATLGFGNALIAMPLLVLTVGIQVATPLVAFVSLLIAMLMLIGTWRHVDVQAAWRLILSAFLGVPVGLWLLTDAPENLVKGILGILLVLFGLYNLSSLHLPTLHKPVYAYPIGFLSGILGGAYNTNGPPIIVYGVLSRWPPDRFRATLQGYFLATGLLIWAGHGIAGLWTPHVLHLFFYSIPVVLLAVWLGSKLSQRIPPGRFNRIIYAALVGVGLVLIV